MSGVRPGGVEDRYVAPLEANRRGAHRARPNPLLGILPLVAVAAVVVAVAGGVVALVGGGGLLPSGKDKTVAGSSIASGVKPSASATDPAASPSTPATDQSPSTQPSKSADSSASPSKSATGGAGEVDKKTKVAVLNATKPGVTGLAKKVTTKLKSAGWSKASTDTTKVAGVVDVTTIYYASSDLKATAQALRKELGVGVLRLSGGPSNGAIAVYIANDYNN